MFEEQSCTRLTSPHLPIAPARTSDLYTDILITKLAQGQALVEATGSVTSIVLDVLGRVLAEGEHEMQLAVSPTCLDRAGRRNLNDHVRPSGLLCTRTDAIAVGGARTIRRRPMKEVKHFKKMALNSESIVTTHGGRRTISGSEGSGRRISGPGEGS